MDLTEAGRHLLERLQMARAQIAKAVGPSGPTDTEIAARAAPMRRHQGRAQGRPPA
jgi:hypothetical protein